MVKTEYLYNQIGAPARGLRVRMIARGSNCVKEFNGCEGLACDHQGDELQISVDKGYCSGRIINFTMGEAENWDYEFVGVDWDV